MSIEAVSGVSPDVVAPSASGTVTASADFSRMLREEFDAVNTQLVSSEQELQNLAAGKQTNIHHVMLKLEEAKVSFQMLMQVRNKMLEAYQELMRTQI